MKKLIVLLSVVAFLSFWACSPKTAAVKTDAQKSNVSKDMIAKVGTFNTGGKINFEAANERYEAQGTFKDWHFSEVNMKKKDIESLSASLKVDLTSIWEKNDDLTAHLKAPDFFNIEKYTTATIDISNVKKVSGDSYTADMKLSMKGLNQVLSSDFTVTSMNPLHVKGTAKVNRSLFGLGSDEMGVGEFVAVNFDTDIPQ